MTRRSVLAPVTRQSAPERVRDTLGVLTFKMPLPFFKFSLFKSTDAHKASLLDESPIELEEDELAEASFLQLLSSG